MISIIKLLIRFICIHFNYLLTVVFSKYLKE